MTVYRAALALAAKGIPVFPCAANAKHPITRHGLNDASTDPAEINAWARRWPNANLAVPAGFRSGLLVIDLDNKNGANGLETLRSVELDVGALPETLKASTPSGGEHRFFKMPSVELRNSAGTFAGCPAPGFDVRGEGGYVLVAPSCVDGKPYRWHGKAPVAELPAAWAAALTPPARERSESAPKWEPRDDRDRTRVTAWCVRALQYEGRELAAAAKGTRNDRLWRAAAALGGLVHTGGIDADDIRRALTWACSTWASRTPEKDRKTLENGLAFGMARPRHVQIGDDRAA